MFVIKSLFGKVWGDPQNAELAQIKAGALYLVRPDSIKGSRECIFKDAVATIRRTTVEFQYQLIITRAYEEGEAELLDLDAETEDERSFLIDPSLEFRASSFDGAPSFTWADLSSSLASSIHAPSSPSSSPRLGPASGSGSPTVDDDTDLFEFITDAGQVSAADCARFDEVVRRCMFERKFGRSSADASREELESLKWTEPVRAYPKLPSLASTTKPGPAKPAPAAPAAGADDPAEQLERELAGLTVHQTDDRPGQTTVAAAAAADDGAPSTAASGPQVKAIIPPSADAAAAPEEALSEELPVIFSGQAEIYLFDPETEYFVVQGKVRVLVIEKNDRPFDYWFACQLEETDEFIIAQPIEGDMNTRWSQEALAFMWNFIPAEADQQSTTWSLRFAQPAPYLDFNHAFNRCLWERTNGLAWGKAKADEQRYVYSAFEDVVMEEDEEDAASDDEREEARKEQNSDASEEESEEDVEEGLEVTDSEDDSDEERAPRPKELNSALAIGFKHDRSFVVQGDRIGVFRHGDANDPKLRHATTITGIKTPGAAKRSFKPTKVMLHNQDSSMLLKSEFDPNSIFRMDLETGKVVDEWKVHDSVQVDNFLPGSKYAQMTAEQTLIGHSHNGIFRIDPRLAGNKMVEGEFKQYAGKNAFSAATTTESGRIAVASNKGDIRLFDAIGKNAKTALPALGDPILGVDVSADGRWLVATCKTYLLLIDTLIGEGRYKGQLGFDRSFPAEAKPVPRRLQLKPEHVSYMQGKVEFTPARFNTGLGEEEKSIVTSSGEFVITWNFRRVKQGRVDDYSIRRYEQKVVADNFRHGADKEIVVALPRDVFMTNKKHLVKPSRESLTTPTKLLKSRSSIVDSRY